MDKTTIRLQVLADTIAEYTASKLEQDRRIEDLMQRLEIANREIESLRSSKQPTCS